MYLYSTARKALNMNTRLSSMSNNAQMNIRASVGTKLSVRHQMSELSGWQLLELSVERTHELGSRLS